MATAPTGQSCGTCAFWIDGACVGALPTNNPGMPPFRPMVSTQWCRAWNVWPGRTTNGGTMSSGTIAPSGGVDGDYYVSYRDNGDHTASTIVVYQKQSGSWVSVLTIGP